MYNYMGAADLVLARAGATTIAELAAQGKATIIVPNPLLTGGHQLLNAQALAKQGAAIVLDEKDLSRPGQLQQMIIETLSNKQRLTMLGNHLHEFAHPNAARELADLLVTTAK
jgi:UDP-N-acetylglucosamine--N-acetylmuramyl-(pentapeptide) pyrophosphoryl-undecaprenol N-acetylglucosamine transferase